MTDPLVVTLALPADLQERLDALRGAHFPPDRNVVPAHVHLFHALPGASLTAVLADLAEVCRRPSFEVVVDGVRSLGRGTALGVHGEQLLALRAELAARWASDLTPQDRQPYRPHVTVQNKVTPDQARALQSALAASWQPQGAAAVGVDVWHYRGGPWEPAVRVPFAAPPA